MRLVLRLQGSAPVARASAREPAPPGSQTCVRVPRQRRHVPYRDRKPLPQGDKEAVTIHFQNNTLARALH